MYLFIYLLIYIFVCLYIYIASWAFGGFASAVVSFRRRAARSSRAILSSRVPEPLIVVAVIFIVAIMIAMMITTIIALMIMMMIIVVMIARIAIRHAAGLTKADAPDTNSSRNRLQVTRPWRKQHSSNISKISSIQVYSSGGH